MFSALYILNFHYEQEFKKLGCGLENATSLPNDVISASTAYHDTPGPVNTGIAIVLTTLHINMMLIQLYRGHLLICQQ